MKNISLVETRTTPAAFAASEVRACKRDAMVPSARVPMPKRIDPAYAPVSRERADGNQHTFMIQAGAAGAGASGPSPWGCPV
ncbi:MAG TPA: hypothetical protein VGL93_15010 [Streptosporangiaceae bacterium]